MKDYEGDVLERETQLTSNARDTGERRDQMRKCQEPHMGKACARRHGGRWGRMKKTNIHGTRGPETWQDSNRNKKKETWRAKVNGGTKTDWGRREKRRESVKLKPRACSGYLKSPFLHLCSRFKVTVEPKRKVELAEVNHEEVAGTLVQVIQYHLFVKVIYTH